MSDLPLSPLDGEADPSFWHFSQLGEVGPLPNPVGHTFPLVTHDKEGSWRLLGTGFYVSGDGLFVTARHVIEDVCHGGRQTSPLIILHLHSQSGLFGASECLFRPVSQCWISDVSDVALGAAAAATNRKTGEQLKNWAWSLSLAVPPNGSPAYTYAFPNHHVAKDGCIRFAPHLYSGQVIRSGQFRDRVMVPFPFIEVDFRVHGAASGGPIIFDGQVVGINCTELPQNLDHPPGPAFGAQSACLAGAFLDNIVLPLESMPRRVTFDELLRAGCLNVTGYSPETEFVCMSGKLIDLSMSISAPQPRIEVEQYF